MEKGTNIDTLVLNALNRWVPDFDYVFIILNQASSGRAGGRRMVVPSGETWIAVAHEFGHGIGGLGDEYCDPTVTRNNYPGPEPGYANLTVNTTSIKWRNFIKDTTPVPTGIGSCAGYNQGSNPMSLDPNQDVGLFEGGRACNLGVYRPVLSCRMQTNTPNYCPVCYTKLKRIAEDHTSRTFMDCYVGDFNGTGSPTTVFSRFHW